MALVATRGGRRRLGGADQPQRDRRDHERDGIREDRERRPDHLDQGATQARPADLGEGRAGRELAVALHDAVHADQRGHVRGIGRAEERPAAADEEDHDVQLLDAQDAGDVGDRDRQQHERTQDVGRDEERSAPHAVDPRAREQADQEHGEARRDDDERHLVRTGAQDEERDQRHRRPRHDRPELRDRLADPELQEIGVPPQGGGDHPMRVSVGVGRPAASAARGGLDPSVCAWMSPGTPALGGRDPASIGRR